MARTQAYTEDQVVDALEGADGVVVAAAATLGCTARTIYNYAERYPAVAEAMKTARRGLVAEMQSLLVRMARDTAHKDQFRAIVKILETYDTETDWSDRQQITGASGGPLMLRWSDED